jgi:hypothetical protein
MGFDCLLCGEREIWAFEGKKVPRVCQDCEAYLSDELKSLFAVLWKTTVPLEDYEAAVKEHAGIRPEGARPTQGVGVVGLTQQ